MRRDAPRDPVGRTAWRWLAVMASLLVLAPACTDEEDPLLGADVYVKAQNCGVYGQGQLPWTSDEAPGPYFACVYECYLAGSCADVQTALCDGEVSVTTDLGMCFQVCVDSHSFTCVDGNEVPIEWQCDGFADCADGTDEANCASVPSFMCGSGGTTLPEVYLCNGQVDCPDGSDELNCPTYDCGNGEQLPEWQRCDGEIQCSNSADEAGCAPLQCGNSAP